MEGREGPTQGSCSLGSIQTDVADGLIRGAVGQAGFSQSAGAARLQGVRVLCCSRQGLSEEKAARTGCRHAFGRGRTAKHGDITALSH